MEMFFRDDDLSRAIFYTPIAAGRELLSELPAPWLPDGDLPLRETEYILPFFTGAAHGGDGHGLSFLNQ